MLKSSFQSGDELAPKDPTEYAHWQEEGIAGMDPASVVRRKASGGDHTMEMRMEQAALTIP